MILHNVPQHALQDVGLLRHLSKLVWFGCSAPQTWRLAKNWRPCAIGALPSLFDPNGVTIAVRVPDAAAAQALEQTCDSGATTACADMSSQKPISQVPCQAESGQSYDQAAPDLVTPGAEASLWIQPLEFPVTDGGSDPVMLW